MAEIRKSKSVIEIQSWLNSIGRVEHDANLCVVENLLSHNNENIRENAIKTLAKTGNKKYIDQYYRTYKTEISTSVKRECASAIGRLRDPSCISFLMEILKDDDPKIVCQAIRGLLIFKGREDVDNVLKALINHKNEMVKQVIIKEFYSTKLNITKNANHIETPEYLHNVAVNGDNLEIMPLVEDEVVHLTFTSPPYYNARDYSIYQSYNEYLDFLEKVFREVMRLTKEGRFLIVNTSPVIVPRISRAHSSKRYPIPFDLHTRLVNLGWEFIDDIIWMKPEYSVKNRIGGFQQHRKPLAYKPNTVTEYLMVYRKPTSKLLDWNIHQYPLDTIENSKVRGDFETTNVWQICPKSDKVHSAVFPEELCKRVIEYYSYKGDLLFDPFGGSGTFGRVAMKMDRYFFMTEKSEEYFKYMKSLFDTNSFLIKKEPTFLSLNDFKTSLL